MDIINCCKTALIHSTGNILVLFLNKYKQSLIGKPIITYYAQRIEFLQTVYSVKVMDKILILLLTDKLPNKLSIAWNNLLVTVYCIAKPSTTVCHDSMQTDLITKVYFNEHLTHSCVGMPQCLQALSSSLLQHGCYFTFYLSLPM